MNTAQTLLIPFEENLKTSIIEQEDMRYLGNKSSIVDHITNLLASHSLLHGEFTFFDAFCGTGTVAANVCDSMNVIINDNLLFATTYAKGRMVKNLCTFENLGFNPVVYFNETNELREGFVYNNYAPTIGQRMYFSDANAQRIDFFRQTIEEWYTLNIINENEYVYLLACLLESISKVANVAGVYGAFLKSWDPRATKPIRFLEISEELNEDIRNILPIQTINGNIEEIIEDVDCDVLYLDPPYTNNSYSVQYHILETIVRNDNPKLKGITGARQYTNIHNQWSKKHEVEVVFEKVIAKTKAKHIIMSYSSDGIMSKTYIINVLKRYCNVDSVKIFEIPYKKYQNFKTTQKSEHFEYLFYAEKIDYKEVEYHCPLNYMGGKTNVISQIKPYLNGRSEFIDLMGGGFNVGINTNSFESVRYNDINFVVCSLLQMFKDNPASTILKHVEQTIKKYGLKPEAKEPYMALRDDYNKKYKNTNKGNLYLYTLILFGFQQQIRFNSNYEFNNPVGMSGYNDSVKEKIVSFSRKIKEMNPIFTSMDFEQFLPLINEKSLVYIDPPYLITLGSYNDGKRGFNGWDSRDEERLMNFVSKSVQKGAKVVISNIIEYKGIKNEILANWIEQNMTITTQVSITVRNRNEILLVIN